MSTYLGIDFGTTRTVVALADRGNYPVLPFADSAGDDHFYLPSLSALTPDGLVHGFAARAAAQAGAAQVRSLKRLLAAADAHWHTPVRVGEVSVALGDLLTGYLRHVRQCLQQCPELEGVDLSAEDTHVVVAVPAHAWCAQRMLTLDAFRAAGFHVVAMLNEPSAAGLEYSHRKARTLSSRRTRVLIYDLGGGTFDTSLVDVAGTNHEILASRGLSDLGGDDIDRALAMVALERAGVAPQALTAGQLEELEEQCRQAKESIVPQTRRVVVEVAGRETVVPVAEVYAACQGLLDRATELMVPLAAGLEGEAGEISDDVAGVYLVGGASAFPPVARGLRERFGRRVHRSPYPGASTAIGLAIAADPASGVAVRDRLSRGFGVFREEDEGRRTVFDPILLPDAVAPTGVGDHAGGGTRVVREYVAAHNVGRYRFVECAGIDEDGIPLGATAPYGEVLFALDAHAREAAQRGALADVVVERRPTGPRVRETYEIDVTGQVRVTLTDLSDGYSRSFVLGERSSVGGAAAVA